MKQTQLKKVRKYFLVQELENGEYKEIDSSFSKPTMENRKGLQEKFYKTNLKIISMEK